MIAVGLLLLVMFSSAFGLAARICGDPVWIIAMYVSLTGLFLYAFCFEVNIWHWIKLTVKCFLGRV